MEFSYIIPSGTENLDIEDLKSKLFHLTERESTKLQTFYLLMAALLQRENNKRIEKPKKWVAYTPTNLVKVSIDDKNNVTAKNKNGVTLTFSDYEIKVENIEKGRV